ncbi:MAG: hypothetical protein HYZ62_01230 [Candidatus Andersenbacteria bacterium]|nr:hypothetical protein [Candidatus Andersenbacteria bacterium]
MKNSDQLIKKADIQRIAEEGAKTYQQIKVKYEPQDNGKFLAIDVDSGKEYLGHTSAEAVELARQHHPDKVFYVMKIGFDTVETIAHSFTRNK